MLIPRWIRNRITSREAKIIKWIRVLQLVIGGLFCVLFILFPQTFLQFSAYQTFFLILRHIANDIWFVPGSMSCQRINFSSAGNTKNFIVEWNHRFNTPEIIQWRREYIDQCPSRNRSFSIVLSSGRHFSPGYGLGVSCNFALSSFLLSNISFPTRNFRLYIVDWNYADWEKIFLDFTSRYSCQIVRTLNSTAFQTITDNTDNLISPGEVEAAVDFGPSTNLLLEIANSNAWRNFFQLHLNQFEAAVGKEEFFRRKSIIARGLLQLHPHVRKVVETIWTQLMDESNGYSAVHIRRSDKISTGEAVTFPIVFYYRALRRLCHLHPGKCSRKVFVLSDDPNVYNEFKLLTKNCYEVSDFWQHVNFAKILPWYNRSSAVFKSQAQFNALSIEDRQSSALELVVSIFLAAMSDFFVCTFTSNMCRLIALLRTGQLKDMDILSLDQQDWSV